MKPPSARTLSSLRDSFREGAIQEGVLDWCPVRAYFQSGDGMPANQQHILLVEDDEPLAEALGAHLRRGGFRVTVTSKFEPALQALEGTDNIDLLIADIVFPGGVNGLALSRMAKLRRRDLRVIYMTGYDIPGLAEQSTGLVLRKPIDDEMLLDAVRRTLRSAHLGADK